MIFGVDSHRSSLSVAGVDELGRVVVAASFGNRPSEHHKLARLIRRHGGELVGVEGSGKYGHALARVLLAAGVVVVDVPPQATERERVRLRGAGKSDERDAIAIARVTAREQERLAPLGGEPGYAGELKLLVDYRRQLTSERTRIANRVHADLVMLKPGYETKLRHLINPGDVALAARLLRGQESVHAQLARRRLAALRRIDNELLVLARDLKQRVEATGTSLMSLRGVGPVVAAIILGETRDVRRFADRARYARLNASAPIPASSGHTRRMRLNPGGNRQLNHALHIIALTQSRCDPRARDYLARKIAAGASHRDAIRCLKRRLSDVIFQLLRADLRAAQAQTKPVKAISISCGPIRTPPRPRPRHAHTRRLPQPPPDPR
jgi:transposase